MSALKAVASRADLDVDFWCDEAALAQFKATRAELIRRCGLSDDDGRCLAGWSSDEERKALLAHLPVDSELASWLAAAETLEAELDRLDAAELDRLDKLGALTERDKLDAAAEQALQTKRSALLRAQYAAHGLALLRMFFVDIEGQIIPYGYKWLVWREGRAKLLGDRAVEGWLAEQLTAGTARAKNEAAATAHAE